MLLCEKFQKRLAALHNVVIGQVKIACIPGVGNIALTASKLQKFIYFMPVVTAYNTQNIANIRSFHSYKVIVFIIIFFGKLHGSFTGNTNAVLYKFIARAGMHRITDFITACSRRSNIEFICQAS